MNTAHTIGSSVMTSVITAVVAMLPGGLVLGVEHILSVLILAMVAEAGRQLVSRAYARFAKWRNK